MRHAQAEKEFLVVAPQAKKDDASWDCNVIDTQGYDYLTLRFLFGDTDIAMVALSVQESDTKSNTTALTSGANITGLVFGTSNGIGGSASTLPSANDDNTVSKCLIDLRGRKRYIMPVATAGNGSTGTYMACVATLSCAEIAPDTATEMGCSQVLRV